MSHSTIIINDRLNELKGNATQGLVVEVQTLFNTCEAGYPNFTQKQQEKHESVSHDLQEWLTEAGTYDGACGEANFFVSEYNDILGS